MTVRTHQMFLLGLLAFISTNLARGQLLDSLTLGVPDAEFVRSGHMGISPDGMIYVPDRTENVVHVLSMDGHQIRILGGPGFSEGQFDGPSDVDPALGLVINISDKQNGRVQRFTKEFRFIESIPISDGPGETVDTIDPSFRAGQAQFQPSTNGRPRALATSSNDDLFIIDEASNLVLRLDRERRNLWWIGEAGQGSGTLEQPVDLLVKDQKLFVADRGCACVHVYDQFGTHIRAISQGQLKNIVAVTSSPAGILVVLESKMIEYSVEGLRETETIVKHHSSLVDAVRTNESWIILGETGLYIIPTD